MQIAHLARPDRGKSVSLTHLLLDLFKSGEDPVQTRVVKADFLKAVRKAVSKRLTRLLKGC